VVLSSASYLAWVGAAAYATEYVSARRRLRAAFGNGVEVLHGLPLVLGGIRDEKGVLAMIDLLNWSNDVHCSRDIIDTRKKCLDLICEMCKDDTPLASSEAGPPLAPASGSPLAPQVHTVPPLATVKYHLSLPADLEKKIVRVFEAVHKLPVKLHTEAVSQEAAGDLLNMLVSELNAKFMTDLGSITALESACSESEAEPEKTTIIFVGGSHSSRLAAAAGGNGIEVVNLSMPGFRVCEETIDTACILLREAVQECSGKVVVVYQLFDNNVFFETREDGSRSLPAKSAEDNKYHIVGRLDFADHNTIKNLVNIATPLLRAGGDAEKIILSPLPRYIKKCCRDKKHLTNRAEPEFATSMGEALSDMRDSLKDLIFGKKIRSFKVLSTMLLITGREDTDEAAAKVRALWRDDAVHMTEDGYSALASAILEQMSSGSYNRPVSQRTAKPERVKKVKRSQWVSQDDTLAHRRDEGSLHKKFRGGGSARGGGGRPFRGWHRGRGPYNNGAGPSGVSRGGGYGGGNGGGHDNWKRGGGRGGRWRGYN
jgi:hypothetical protein